MRDVRNGTLERLRRVSTNTIYEWERDIECRKLPDELDIASTDLAIDVLIVSPETADELKEIDDLRRERYIDPILGIVVPYVLAEDRARISSTRMVKHGVDKHGPLLS